MIYERLYGEAIDERRDDRIASRPRADLAVDRVDAQLAPMLTFRTKAAPSLFRIWELRPDEPQRAA